MKKLILVLILAIPSLCWGWMSPENEVLYKQAWELYGMQEIQQAIDLVSKVINDQSISDVDKLHFLMSRSIFLVDHYERKKDLDKVKELTIKNEDCAREYAIYYH